MNTVYRSHSVGWFGLVALLAGAFCTMSSSAQPRGDTLFQPAERLIDARYLEQIGRTLAVPRREAARMVQSADCEFTCDAVVPRQSVMKLRWQGETARGSGAAPSGAISAVRVDICGTAQGFQQGNYSTIRLRDIPSIDAPLMESTSLRPTAAGQQLLNRVRGGVIVERPAAIPVFDQPVATPGALNQLSEATRAVIEEDRREGFLSQVRVLGRAMEVSRGDEQQVVRMVGLQPGITYRVRVVEEAPDGGETIVERICRVPVCPADFADAPR